jgi:ribosomal protein S3
LTLVETTVMHLRTFTNWPFKPMDWCIALHGKIGSGVIRSRSQYIKIGYLPLQSISLPVNYTYRQADTKYGSIGVKVWMRHP